MDQIARSRKDAFPGVIVEHAKSSSHHVEVKLEDGRHVKAVISKSVLRKLGCVFGLLVGWHVRVVLRESPMMAKVVEIRRNQLENEVQAEPT
jgi:hypothetical protein